jgi:transcriptional regulator GlxA family with amidase domain
VPRASTDRRGVGDPCVARALDYIAAHLAEPIRAPDVAAASGLSQRQLTRRMRDARGRTIVQEMRHARLAEARHLLATTDLPLAAIARQTGFASRRALTAAFGREFAITPSAWRQRERP